MPLVGVNYEPLEERAIFGFDGTDYRVVKVDTAGQIVAALQAGSTITVTQATAANLNATATLAANQNVQARDYGWYSGAWQKNPLLMGYSAAVGEAVTNTSLAAGANTLSSTAVPAGEVHVITNIAAAYSGTVTNVILTVRINDSGTIYELYGQKPPVTGVYYDRQGFWVLKPGAKIDLLINGATLNDDGFLYIAGFSFDIDQ